MWITFMFWRFLSLCESCIWIHFLPVFNISKSQGRNFWKSSDINNFSIIDLITFCSKIWYLIVIAIIAVNHHQVMATKRSPHFPKQKISNCFRTFTSAEIYARIEGFVSTARKHNQNVFSELCTTFAEHNIISG